MKNMKQSLAFSQLVDRPLRSSARDGDHFIPTIVYLRSPITWRRFIQRVGRVKGIASSTASATMFWLRVSLRVASEVFSSLEERCATPSRRLKAVKIHEFLE